MHVHDLVGIGFGPSNIALAIVIEEFAAAGEPIDAVFLEKQECFSWHRGMLLDDSHLQVSFLKDLATLRNPRSPFTFINYLHDKGRLQDFINLKTFYPSRQEFNDYLGWAAAQLDGRCVYGEEVIAVLPEENRGTVSLLRVCSRDRGGVVHERLTRNLVIGIGGTPGVPACFSHLKDDGRVFHSNSYLAEIGRHAAAERIAIVGAGQSAAEIFMDLHGRPGAPAVDLIMRARTIRPSDDSPFVNEIFNAEFTDYMFSRTPDERAALLDEFWHTNYAAPDLPLIQRIFSVFYQQKVTGGGRHRFLRHHEVDGADATGDGIRLSLHDLDGERRFSATYDAVILATGYARQGHAALLEPLACHFDGMVVDRTYRLKTRSGFQPAIFLQGACESSHGLSDTLLSVMAVRTGEIGRALLSCPRLAHVQAAE